MNRIDCGIIRDLLPLYVDRVCSEESQTAVEQHLSECDACAKEYKAMTGEVPLAVETNGSSAIEGIAKHWKRDKQNAFAAGGIGLFLIVAVIVAVMLFANGKVPVSATDVAVEHVSRLEDGSVFFTLDLAKDIYATDIQWTEEDGAVYITVNKVRYNLFRRENEREKFGQNTPALSNWRYEVEHTGIHAIYYREEKAGKKQLLWSDKMDVPKASADVKTYVRTYAAYGNMEPGYLANELYANAHPYVGDMSANGALANALHISTSLGAYKNELQTQTEPYGWTLEFTEGVEPDREAAFNKEMTGYAYVLLALTENLGTVSWTYPTAEGEHTETVDASEASQLLGGDIKEYGESAIQVQELLLELGME